jgi:hypothetical protein
MERDGAIQRLRELTIWVGIAALGAVGLLAWISASTIPGQGSSSPSSEQSSTPTSSGYQASTPGGDASQQPSLFPAVSGSGLVVSGGSH